MKKNILMTLLLVLTLLLCGCSGEKEEAYRIIQVLEVTGSVSVERQSMGSMEPYEGMRLESGDKITVGADSWLKIKMDEDKYALVEPSTVLRLEASGSSADSKTVLHLDSGAVSNRLEETLSDASSYEVNTPNSTMAVRGTVFRVEVTVNEDGISIADVSVYDGSVASRLIHPDGSVDPEGGAVLIVDGTAAQIWGNNILSRYVTTSDPLELDDLALKTLKFLQEAVENGQELRVSPEELKELIEILEQEPESAEPVEATTVPAGETTEPTEETTVPTTAPTTPRPTTPSSSQGSGSDNSGSSDSSSSEDETTTATTEATTEATELTSYTVTFLYGSTTFATQTVTSGETAAVPALQPAASGSWNFDFSEAITGDTEISWS